MRARAWVLATGLALASCGPPATDAQRLGPEPIEPRVAATIEAPHIVSAISAGAGGVWTANYENGTVSLVDPQSNAVSRTLEVAEAVGSLAYDVHATEDAVWLTAELGVGHIDPRDLTVSRAARFPSIVDMAVTDSHVWLSRTGAENEHDPVDAFGVEIRSANAVVPLPDRHGVYSDIAAGDAGVWALDESDGTLAAIAPAEGEPRVAEASERLFRGAQAEIAVAHGSVWVETSAGAGSRLTRYDPATSETESVEVAGEDGILAVGQDAVWVLTHEDDRGLLWSVDPETLSLEGPLVLKGNFRLADISYGFGSLWISYGTNLVARIAVTIEGTQGAHVPPPEQRGSGEVCDQPGSPWIWCPEARWLRRVVHDAGLEVIGETGAALRVRAGDLELFAWNTDATEPVAAIARDQGYEPREGFPAYEDGERILWEAQGLHVYLSSADERPIDTLSDEELSSLVDASLRVPMEADMTGAKPQPTPTGDQRFELLDDGRLRVWPVTEDVEDRGRYLFSAPHCGLDWMIDFDASFWEAIKPADYGTGENYPFFYNSDEGVITFTGDDTAIYQASTGEEIRLRRLSGPIITFPCS